MGLFLTHNSRIEQTDEQGYWKLIDNELYFTNNGKIIITPRYLWTDGYTIPSLFMPFVGDKNKYDVRPAHAHDLACRFHQLIYVTIPIHELKSKDLLRIHNDMWICEDIPEKYLVITKIKKTEADDLLKEMMEAANISDYICNVFRFAVRFNFNWYKNGKEPLENFSLFNEDIGLVNGL